MMLDINKIKQLNASKDYRIIWKKRDQFYNKVGYVSSYYIIEDYYKCNNSLLYMVVLFENKNYYPTTKPFADHFYFPEKSIEVICDNTDDFELLEKIDLQKICRNRK